MRISFLIWVTLLGFSGYLQGQTFQISTIEGSQQLHQYLRFQVDSTQQPLSEILRRPFLNSVSPTFYGRPQMTFWTKLEVQNNTKSDQFVVTIDQWNEAVMYFQQGDTWKEIESGTDKPVFERPLSLHRLLSFPIVINPGETKTIIFKTRITQPLIRYYASLFSFLSKVEIDESAHAYRKYIGNQLFVMLIVGVTMILFLYNLILFLFDKQRTSLILSCYFILIALVISNVHGITTNYFFTSLTGFEMPLALHLAHLTPLVISSFLFSFFKLQRRDWETWLLVAFGSFIVFSWFYSFITAQSLFYFARRYFEYGVFISITVSSLTKNKSGSAILLVALMVTIVTSYFAEFRAVFFRNTTFTAPDTPYLIGVLIQVLIFSVAATYRVRSLQEGVTAMKEEQRQLIEQQNIQLKTQVEEKTRELQNTLISLQQKKSELESANVELLQQSNSIKELNQKLETLVVNRTDALHATMRDLDMFLYRTSHDLRRPLMTILGISNLVRAESEIEKAHDLMTHINKTVRELDKMLKKLIAISFCYNQNIEKESVDLHEAVHEVANAITTEYLLDRSQLVLVLPEKQLTVQSSGYLLKVMLGCVLENAIQYGGSNVQIALTLESLTETAQLVVHDNGPGIDLEYQKPVFDMFFRAHEKSTGNGLGLYLVKIGMERLGGSVKLQSAFGSGTEIRLSLSK